MRLKELIIITLILLVGHGCEENEFPDNQDIKVSMQADSLVFAVIGDYGLDGENEANVAELVKGWDPDFIITTGDNNYEHGELSTIKDNISKYYGDYIYNYDAEKQYRCSGDAFEDQVNRFFPSPGNHDTYGLNGMKPYLEFFTLPGNEEFYTFSWGDIAFYSLNSTATFIGGQEAWLTEQMEKSEKTFNIVYFHHSPYSSARHGNERKMQMDYHGLGVDVVFTGHDHIYSRIERTGEEGLYYVINGASGKSLYDCGVKPLDEETFSETCYDEDYGAIKGTWNGSSLHFEFYAVSDTLEPVDHFILNP